MIQNVVCQEEKLAHKLIGGCHCGNVRLDVELSRAPESFKPRACDCDFCRKHGASYLSDPHGALRIWVKNERDLGRYRQGSGIADCLFCKRCGVLAAITYQSDGRLFATVNSAVVEGSERFGDKEPVSPKALSAIEKATRWQSLWFPHVEIINI